MFRILKGGEKSKNQDHNPGLQESRLWSVQLLGRITWLIVLERRGVKESLLIFKDHLLQAQEWSVPTCRKSSKGCRRPAWINNELVTKFKHKKEV